MPRTDFARPRGFPSVSMTHRVCEALRQQLRGGSTSRWLSERAFYDFDVPKAMRRRGKMSGRTADGWEPFPGFGRQNAQ